MEGDFPISRPYGGLQNFNPLPPHGGRHSISCGFSLFGLHFNPLPPHGGRPCAFSGATMPQNISIHSLRMEGDYDRRFSSVFLNGISIHSLRMEGDLCAAYKVAVLQHFNPLPPHGGRLSKCLLQHLTDSKFQSTPSAWRETIERRCENGLVRHFNPLPPHGGRPFVVFKTFY